jgi:uncharacterized protein (TIGR00730 family)
MLTNQESDSSSTDQVSEDLVLSKTDQDRLRAIEKLCSMPASDPKATFLKEMLLSVIKLHEADVDVLNIKILNRALKELRYGFKVFHPYRRTRKVSIFGSARTPPEDPNYQLGYRFGRLLSERGFMVITGAGPGIMLAGHEGAGHEHSFGVNIMLPFEQGPNPLIADNEKLVHLKYFFSRKLLFVKESHATALFPGGFGTLDEGFEVLTLIQTGKANLTPVVCLEAPGCDYWERWMDFINDQLLARGFISNIDLALFKIFHEEEGAVEEIETFYRNYHSSRFVNDQFVLRYHHPLDPEHLAKVNETFRDLLVTGRFVQSAALPEEDDEPDLARLSRLVFQYNRKDVGRLRQLIDWLNGLSYQPNSTESPSPRSEA